MMCVTQGIELNFKRSSYKSNQYGVVCTYYINVSFTDISLPQQLASLLRFLFHTRLDTHTHTHTHARARARARARGRTHLNE